MEIVREQFGYGRRGEKIFRYTLKNDNGVTIKITNYGAIITAIETPDKHGNKENIAIGFHTLADYLSDFYIDHCPYLGAVCGRYANRIGRGKFTLNGKEYTLATNDGANHLHGGLTGFDKVVWVPKKFAKPNEVGVEMKYRALHMEEGYPGNVDITVVYSLNHKNELHIDYKATTDQTTVINLTNHTYFNLAGKGQIFNHELQINARKRTVNDHEAIPTGEMTEVSGSEYDFTAPAKIADKIGKLPIGYDLNYVLNSSGKLSKAAVVSEENSGRRLEVYTTEPGLQFYTGYYMPEMTGACGEQLSQYCGLALETQHFPDSPNRPQFPSTLLNPGETFKSKTVYKFGW
jgi:aldose 1-epimerase